MYNGLTDPISIIELHYLIEKIRRGYRACRGGGSIAQMYNVQCTLYTIKDGYRI